MDQRIISSAFWVIFIFLFILGNAYTQSVPIPAGTTSGTIPMPTSETQHIPAWIENNARWWAEDLIDDFSFALGIQFLIKEGIITVPRTTPGTRPNEIPAWFKNNAGWWAEGLIDDDSFIQAIEFLIKEDIMIISS